MPNIDLTRYPGSFKPGCLPRRSRPGELCPMAADRVPLVPEDEWDRWGQEVNLRPFVRTVLDQDGVGSCAAEATTQAVMIARAIAGLPHVVLNPWTLYCYTSGGVDRGSSIDENLRVAMERGIAPMNLWPRSKGWRAKPTGAAAEAALLYRPAEFWDVADVSEHVSCLLKANPVVWGANGHAVCAVHYDSRGPLIVNSWGEEWEDDGFGVWTPYTKINWSYGAFAVRCSAAPDAQEIT